jgi:hypothetical protein
MNDEDENTPQKPVHRSSFRVHRSDDVIVLADDAATFVYQV